MTTDELRTRYKELKAMADEAYAATEPQRAALREAEEPHLMLMLQIDNLLYDSEVEFCESCSEPIFEDDKRNGGDCEACAPSYRDMLASPWNFMDSDEGPMPTDEAQRICDAHVAAGGFLDDKIVS